MTYIAFILKYRTYLIGAAIVIAILGVAWYIHDDGKREAIAAVETEVAKVTEKVHEVKARVRNNPPDRAALVDSLLKDSF